MTKKKTILGIVGGLLVICGIGAATGCDIDDNSSYVYKNSSAVESSVVSVQSTDSSSVFSSSEFTSSSIVESSVTSVESSDSTSFFSSSVYKSSSVAESNVTSVQSTYSSSASSSSTVEPVSSVSSAETPRASIPSTTSTTTSATTSTSPSNVSPTVPSTPQYNQGVVYIAASGNGKKYHRSPNCSNMNGNVIEMTKGEAEAAGYGPCKKRNCYG